MSEEDKPKRKISNAELDNVKNYMAVELAYNLSVCLPYKDGVALLASLENAEKVSINSYGDKPIKFEPGHLTIQSKIVTQQEYRKEKMNALLGVENE